MYDFVFPPSFETFVALLMLFFFVNFSGEYRKTYLYHPAQCPNILEGGGIHNKYLLTNERVIHCLDLYIVSCKVKKFFNSKIFLLLSMFQQLNDEVQYIMKESEELTGKGAPVKEKSQQLKDLIYFHQKQKERIQDYEDILYKVVQFHQVKEEVRLRRDV